MDRTLWLCVGVYVVFICVVAALEVPIRGAGVGGGVLLVAALMALRK